MVDAALVSGWEWIRQVLRPGWSETRRVVTYSGAEANQKPICMGSRDDDNDDDDDNDADDNNDDDWGGRDAEWTTEPKPEKSGAGGRELGANKGEPLQTKNTPDGGHKRVGHGSGRETPTPGAEGRREHNGGA
ncbi:uncharacterized protein PV09_00423 [Verruconis gallopava]|uniref:Uncharacterized protein n=1 Tax=Verruconis gallopava TaxID=253628 RepID=A0A0D2ASU7_9PEZI|nr:uncharacterized protein PV09_00423 [Verruconis gallopava]KIW09550.1 hypothetical protein PV09_00423 [Verruconis gallopava]